MRQVHSRRGFLGLMAGSALAGSFVAGPAFANAPLTSLRPLARGEDLLRRSLRPAADLVADARLNGQVSYSVTNVKTGLVLEEMAPQTGQPPASVAKALTAAYALSQLGQGHLFRTRLLATGPVNGGVINGDLVLAGGGDPTLDTDAIAGLASALKKAGVREVKGKFLVWGGALPFERVIDAGQPDHVGYNPAVSGLMLNYNRVHFEWQRGGSGYQVTMDARSATHRPDVRVARMAVVDRSAPIYTYSDAGGHDAWTVAQGALGNGGARWLPVRKPELYAGEVFQTFARSHGIQLKAPELASATPAGAELASHASPPLGRILRDMLKWSTNLTAEAVGMAATQARLGSVASLLASADEMSAWARGTWGLTSCALVDHSGLGDASRVSSSDMVRALIAARKTMELEPLLKPIAMRDGQRNLLKDHPVTVRAKTGTLNFVSGLAGFMVTSEGAELAFAIFAADTDRRAGLSRAERERPEGGASWNRRAKILQQALIDRWGVLYPA